MNAYVSKKKWLNSLYSISKLTTLSPLQPRANENLLRCLRSFDDSPYHLFSLIQPMLKVDPTKKIKVKFGQNVYIRSENYLLFSETVKKIVKKDKITIFID